MYRILRACFPAGLYVPRKQRGGFTLTELLIVVAIIAILMAIAVPNFLGAQTRTRVVRAKAEMRLIGQALAAYAVDHGAYPPPAGNGSGGRLFRLSTPIAYMHHPKRREPFRDEGLFRDPPYGYHGRNDLVNISWNNDGAPGVFSGVAIVYWYVLRSSGPDNDRNGGGASALNDFPSIQDFVDFIYDPSNGTISTGDIWRWGGSPTGQGRDSVALMDP